jgi:hypothetical protein
MKKRRRKIDPNFKLIRSILDLEFGQSFKRKI